MVVIDKDYLIERFGSQLDHTSNNSCVSVSKGKEGQKQALQDCKDEYIRAHSKAERLLAHRDRSSEELRKKLLDDGFSIDTVDTLIERLVSSGAIDDVRFATSVIAAQLRKGYGLVGVEHKLNSYGIDVANIPGFPDEFLVGIPSEVERALELLRTTPPKSKNALNGAYQKLLRKGYSPDVARKAAYAWLES